MGGRTRRKETDGRRIRASGEDEMGRGRRMGEGGGRRQTEDGEEGREWGGGRRMGEGRVGRRRDEEERDRQKTDTRRWKG